MAKKESGQREYMSEMNNSTTKINAILGRFEYIDQEALMELSQIAENDENLENTSQSLFEDAKNNVSQYMIEIKELSESQTVLLDTLKLWFQNLGKNEEFLNNEQKRTNVNTNKGEIIEFMSNYISETEEKMEKAQNIHQDVSQFWMKQIKQFKKEIYQKNSEISHLKSSIESLEAKASKPKRQPKKEKEPKNALIDSSIAEKVQSQLRTIEEQKHQIEDLRNQLKEAQISHINLSINKSNSSDDKNQIKMAEKENEIGKLRYELDLQVKMLKQRIEQLENQCKSLQNDVISEHDKHQLSLVHLNNSKLQIQELENSIQKYIKLLEIERNKPIPSGPASNDEQSKESILEERMLDIAKCKEEIRELKLKQKEDLINQAEILKSKFALEKQELIDSLSSNDQQVLIQSIVSQYDKRLEEQSKNYEELKTEMTQQWGRKLSLLTRQYETRLKNQQASNEVSLLRKKEEIQYEVQKAKLELEDDFNKKVLDISQIYSNKMAKMESLNNRLETQNNDYKKEIEGYKEILNLKVQNEASNNEIIEDESEKNAFNSIEILLDRTDTIKTELNEQKCWELEKQKEFYSQQLQKTNEENQKEIRSVLLSLQDSLSHVDSEGENSLTVSNALNKVSDSFATLNNICEKEEIKDGEEKISLKEASERMNLLKDKIISLTNENEDLRKANPNLMSFDSENESLKMRIKYLESLQNGDTDESIKELQKVDQELRMEIEIKNAIIDKLKSKISTYCTFETIDIFSKQPSNDDNKPRPNNNNPPKATISDNDSQNQNPENSIANDNIHILNNYLIKQAFSKEICFTQGIFEIPMEYFEEEELNDQQKTSENDLHSSNTESPQASDGAQTPRQKVIVKTKIKTVIREVPKIEYVEKPRAEVLKLISSLIAIEIFERQPNLSFRRGQSMTLGVSGSSNSPEGMETKVIDETTPNPEIESQQNSKENNDFTVKITNSSLPIIFDQNMFSSPNPFTIQKIKDGIHPYQEMISSKSKILKDNSPTPPPNSPNIVLVDASTLTHIELDHLPENRFIDNAKAKLHVSKPSWQAHIPNRITNCIFQAVRVTKGTGSMITSEFDICDFNPQPPKTVYIAADEETQEKIDSLQQQIRNLSLHSSDQKIRNDMLRQIPEAAVLFRDRSIEFKDHVIDSLRARVQTNEDQLRRIKEQKLADIRRKSRAFYSVCPLAVDSAQKSDQSTTNQTSENESPNRDNKKVKILENKTLISESFTKSKTEARFMGIEPVKGSADPIQEIIRILQVNSNFLENHLEVGQQIINDFNGDINAFESFLRATKSFDENNEQFIKQLKKNEKLISDYYFQLNTLQARQNKALSVIRNFKEEEDKRTHELTDGEKLRIQQKVLEKIQKNAENSESSINPRFIIDQIETAIKIIDNTGLGESDDEEGRILQAIKYKVKKFKNQIDNNETIDISELKILLAEMQNYISRLKSKVRSLVNNTNLLSENEELKKKINKYKKAKEDDKKELASIKDKQISFETQINLLKSRIAEQQEIAENSSSMYFAQIASLRSIVDQIGKNDPNSPDFINQIKTEILNLQTISETAVREKELYKIKANEAEDRLVQADTEKATAVRELNELQAKVDKLSAIVKKSYDEKLFYESDIKKLKTEKAIEVEAQRKIKAQLDQMVEDNEKTNQDLKEKTEKIEKLKKQLNSLKSENDELTIKAAFGFARKREVPKTSKATQTMFRRVKKQNKEETSSNSNVQKNEPTEPSPTEKVEKSKSNNVVVFENINNTNEQIKAENNTTEDESKIIDENEPIDANFDDIPQPNLELFKATPENSNSQILLGSSNSSLSSQVEWQEEIDPDTYHDVVLHTEETTKQSYENIEKGEKAVSLVHSPLTIKKKKNTIVQSPQKTYMSPKSNKIRPKTVVHASRTSSNSEELTIGNVSPGKRQITGATQSPKPLLSQKLQYGAMTPIINMQALKPLEPLESSIITTNYDRFPSTEPVSPKCHHNTPLPSSKLQSRKPQNLNHHQQAFVTSDENGLGETVRITKYDVEGGNQNSIPKTPLIAPRYEDQISSSQEMSMMQMPKMAEVHKVMVRLREKLLKLQNKLEKKTEMVSDLKKKLSDINAENKQQRLSILKAEDEAKRAVNRFDSLKVRYDIIFKELSEKEDDLSNCKRELSELRKIAAPAASSLSRLRNAQREQLRILHEKERQKEMISFAKPSLRRTTNAEAQKYLSNLKQNTEKSIARLEAKRKMWKDVEKKQIMGTLGALSLIDDKKSLLSLKKTISFVNSSPFRSKLTQKNRFSSVDLPIDDEFNIMIPAVSKTPNNNTSLIERNEQALNLTPVFAKQLENINNVKPELSEEEKKQIIRGNLQPGIAARILATEKEKEEQEKLDNVIITPVKK